MDNEIRAWLYDILNAIMEIEGFFSDRSKEFSNYQTDVRTKRAVERNIEIIGEALSRVLKRDETIIISNSRKIVDTRNRIIHGYDSVSDDVIWGNYRSSPTCFKSRNREFNGRVRAVYFAGNRRLHRRETN